MSIFHASSPKDFSRVNKCNGDNILGLLTYQLDLLGELVLER